MLTTIIFKEIHDNILNLRFIVGFILCVLLTLSCVMILTHDYRQEVKDYGTRISQVDDFLGKYAHRNRLYPLILPQKPPDAFRPLMVGIPRDADLGSFDDNPLPAIFPPLDLMFIVTIIMSLLAILFSYDAVSGERESGTLKLISSNSVSRASILVGKWVGGTISLLIPFLFSVLAGGLYIAIQPDLPWDTSAWLSFVMLVLASVTFISVFYLLGLFVSAVTRSAAVSILSSIFLWVLLVLVLPNLSPFLAAQLKRIPSVNKVNREVFHLTQEERDEVGRKLSQQVRDKYQKQYGKPFEDYLALAENEIRARVSADPQLMAMHESFRKEVDQAWEEANRIQGEKARKIQEDLKLKAESQTRLARQLACLSPYADYAFTATDISGTGMRSLRYFEGITEEYSGVLWDYLQKKEVAAKARDPLFDENSFIDLGDRPRFEYREEPLRARLKGVLPYWGVLLVFNCIFFAGAFVAFIRYDVR